MNDKKPAAPANPVKAPVRLAEGDLQQVVGGITWNGTDRNDTIYGFSGDDTISGGGGNDTLCGGFGNDVVNGDDGDDLLQGWEGNDVVNGGAGNDWILGGRGNDVLDGGTGNDRIYVFAGEGRDVVHGGTDAQGNDVDFLMVDPRGSSYTFTFEQGGFAEGSNNQPRPGTQILLQPGTVGTITFQNGSSVAFDGIERIQMI